jgi:quinol monooxygenase YgiN
MVIVGGTFEVQEGSREQFLVERFDLMRTSRAEQGCLEYTFSADPLNPRRVVLFEVWERKEDLDAHLASLRAAPSPSPARLAPISSSITAYDVAGEVPLGT